jgi:ElaB/YqjD/DUF883 family membrane-anchored ribosome-binding protein
MERTMEEPNTSLSEIVSTSAPDLSSDLAQLRADFARLSDSVTDLMKGQVNVATKAVKDNVTNAGSAITNTVNDVGASTLNFANSAQDSMRSASNDLQATVKQNPVAAALLAAGLGLVLGMVTARGA